MACGDVSSDFGKADEVTRGLADWVDHDMRPNARSVLPNPPALLLKAAFSLSRLKRAGWETCGAILFGVEPGEMLAEDLLLGVALEPLSPAFQLLTTPMRVEHVDRVIGNRLD
jgi:hypothetical protein